MCWLKLATADLAELANFNQHIQMRDLAIKHLKYWFRISSILERTKSSTKTNNISFERSDSKLFKSWRLGAWHSNWPATPTLYDKLTFLGKEGVASPWCCHALVLQDFFVHFQSFHMRYCMSSYHFYFSSKLSSKFKVWNFSWLYIINQNVFRTLKFELYLKEK